LKDDMAKYSAKSETLLVTLLAKGATVPQAARQAGVSERTVYRRRQQPDFQARIQAIQDETLGRVASFFANAIQDSIRVLIKLQGPDSPPHVRRAAASNFIRLGLRCRELADLDQRLAQLESSASDTADNAGVGNAGVQTAKPASPLSSLPSPAKTRRRRGDVILQAALASGDSVAQAAAKANLSERTVYRRLQDPDFQRGLNAVRSEMLQRAAALFNAGSVLAAKTLLDLQDESMPPTVRRGASRDMIEFGRQLYEFALLDKRLNVLEDRLLKKEPAQT
jgi:transposase